ncbi:hypothetical protein [Mycolicibacterium sp. 120270]|uniref:hypothetical protein n=1 Tax=Mycolicibacterium sp. 120270 TaxID=3090600 RepID=UPI00299D2E19|nr:hypothetical protein [Mycolicibacterium sp. 120270]MDX1883248.1 hypothetical protein [Mycolicibacterium sp. 120270]
MAERKKWTVLDTVQVVEAVIDNDGQNLTGDQYAELAKRVGSTRSAIEPMVWRIQTVLGYPVTTKAQGITALDRAVAQLYRDHDPRVRT